MAEVRRTTARRGRRGRDPMARGGKYLLPDHPAEIDRLDVQHYALRAVVGTDLLAPVERPGRILDVGSGSGQWAFDMCGTFPGAIVVGFDLQAGKGGGPASYRFVRGNLLHGLPFAADRFDVVHQRFLTPGIPLRRWAAVLADLVRVTRPGGWVELVESAWSFIRAGTATERLTELGGRLGRTLGLDTTGVILRSLEDGLDKAGLTLVERRDFELPIGQWGGQTGSLMFSDIRAAFLRMCDVYEARGDMTGRECRELVATAMDECEQLESCGSIAIAFGCKPDSC